VNLGSTLCNKKNISQSDTEEARSSTENQQVAEKQLDEPLSREIILRKSLSQPLMVLPTIVLHPNFLVTLCLLPTASLWEWQAGWTFSSSCDEIFLKKVLDNNLNMY
jgi:hypothetical protein